MDRNELLKKVKAIVVHGTKQIPVANVAAYREAGMTLFKACKDAEGLKPWQDYGTTIVVSWCDEVGALPTRNHRESRFEAAAAAAVCRAVSALLLLIDEDRCCISPAATATASTMPAPSWPSTTGSGCGVSPVMIW